MKRIAIGFVTCCLLLVGTSIAKSEFALNATDWFKTKFEFIAKESSELNQGLTSIDEAATTQKEESLVEVELSLEDFGFSTIKGALVGMDKYKGDYMQEILETQEILMDSKWVKGEDMQEIIDEIDSDFLDILEDILSE